MARRSGRPTKTEQAKIKRAVIGLRAKGFEASYIITETGYDKDTVYKYVREFDGELFSGSNVDAAYLNQIRQRMSHSYDTLIHKSYSLYETLEKEANSHIQNRKPVPKHIYQIMREILFDISGISGKKWDLLMRNPLVENHEQAARKHG